MNQSSLHGTPPPIPHPHPGTPGGGFGKQGTVSPALSEGFVLGGNQAPGPSLPGRRGGLFALSFFFVLPHFFFVLVLILEEESVIDVVQ